MFIQIAMMAVLYAIVFIAPNSQHIVGMHPGRHVVTPRPMADEPEPGWLRMNAAWGVVTGMVLIAAILGIGAKSEFLYFQF